MDLPARQRTLRATMEWSIGLPTDAERSLLEVTAVFTDGWTIPAAAQVAGLDEDRALELGEAALLEGAAEGLRRRVGLRAWPVLRRAEAELVAQVRQRLGAARFDHVFSTGSGLAQQQAVAIVRDQRGTGTQTP